MSRYSKKVFDVNSLSGKNVLITGAATGIGKGIAQAMSLHGAKIGIHYNSSKNDAEKLYKSLKLKGKKIELFQGNLLEKKIRDNLIKEFINEFNSIDLLVNNAGSQFEFKHFSLISEKVWDNTFDLNVKSVFYLTKSAFSFMKDNKGGKIINISAGNVKFGGSPKNLHNVASKAAVESLTLGFAREGAKYNILVNCIRPGLIDTSVRFKLPGYDEEQFKKRQNLIPLKKAGKPNDIAQMALYLASSAGNYITGQVFSVTGGE